MPPSTVLCCFTLVIPSACLPIKSGLPARILSSREIRLTAPDFVLGGKNSREKNLSLLSHLGNNNIIFRLKWTFSFQSHLALIFSARVAPKLFMLIGEAGRELWTKELGQGKKEGESCWISILAVSKLQPMERKSEVGETGKGSWVKHPIGGLDPHFLL